MTKHKSFSNEDMVAIIKLALEYNALIISQASLIYNTEKPVNEKRMLRHFRRITDDYTKKLRKIYEPYLPEDYK